MLIGCVRGYQWTIAPMLGAIFGPVCRFEPTCSHYFIKAVRKHGPLRGSWRGFLRVLRCHPWHPGGYDPP